MKGAKSPKAIAAVSHTLREVNERGLNRVRHLRLRPSGAEEDAAAFALANIALEQVRDIRQELRRAKKVGNPIQVGELRKGLDKALRTALVALEQAGKTPWARTRAGEPEMDETTRAWMAPGPAETER